MESTLGVVLIVGMGVLIVVGGILVLRLHAFLALILAALAVAGMTPTASVERVYIESAGYKVIVDDSSSGEVLIDGAAGQGLRPGMLLVLLAKDPKTRRLVEVSQATIVEFVTDPRGDRPWSKATLDKSDAPAAVRGPLTAIEPLAWRGALRNASKTIGERVATGFGNTCISVGILVAMASIIGNCLMHSGAADRIVRTLLRWFGERAAPAAFMSSGFLLGIPVFFDTVFYLMIPLGKAMYLRTGKNYLLYVLTIVCGATMAHSLVPPTPGPLIAAEQLNVELGTMIVAGTLVGLVASASGYLFAAVLNRLCTLPLRDDVDLPVEKLRERAAVDESQLPPFGLSLLPILIPVILIAADTVVGHKSFPLPLSPAVERGFATLGDKNIAILIGAAVGMYLMIRQTGQSLTELAKSMQSALSSAGVIILITAAGGAFGTVLKETGVASLFQQLPSASPAMLCTLAFLVTTAIRTAQGSATVAMITAGGIFTGIAHDPDLTFHPVYLALAIGCGSKPFAWMNDSGFWVMTRMSGMTEAEGLKFISPMTLIMGIVGLGATLVGVTFLPNL